MKALLTICLIFFSASLFAQSEPSKKVKSKKDGGDKEVKPANEVVADSIKVHGPISDSLKQSANQAIRDSINGLISLPEELGLPENIESGRHLKSLALDSLDNREIIQNNAHEAEWLRNALNIPADSSGRGKLKQQAKTIATDTLNNNKYIKGSANGNIDLHNALEIKMDSASAGSLKRRVKSVAIDSLNNREVLKNNGLWLDASKLDSLSHFSPDSAGVKIKEEAVKRTEAALMETEEMKTLAGLQQNPDMGGLNDSQAKMDEIQQLFAQNELKQKLVGQAKQYLTNNVTQVQQIQGVMNEAKQKYSSVANSEDMSTAVKRRSLEEESLWKRLVLGGNFNVTKTNPLNIDFSPVVGYRFNKLFEAGVTAAYRTEFKINKLSVSQTQEEVFGYSVFASHMVYKKFFGYLETEMLRKGGGVLEAPRNDWHQTLLIGVGRKFHITKWLDMQSMVVVNVLHDNKDGLYNSPVIFKTGIRKRN